MITNLITNELTNKSIVPSCLTLSHLISEILLTLNCFLLSALPLHFHRLRLIFSCVTAFLHMAQLMSLPLTITCYSKIQIGFTFLVPARTGSPRQRAVKRVCVCAFLPSSDFALLSQLWFNVG